MASNIDSIALLLDGETVQKWQHRAVRKMVSESDTSVDLLVIKDKGSGEESGSLGRDDFTAWNLYRAVHRRVDETPSYKESISIEEVDWASGSERRYSEPISEGGFGNELPEDVIEQLRGVDVCIRFGFGIVVGEALSAPEHGVLSFHHGDITEYRGRPGGFWELANGESEAGVTLQQLTETLDGGKIVLTKRVDIADAGGWREVQDRLFRASDSMLADGVQRLEAGHSPSEPDQLGPLNTNPGWMGMLKYGMQTLKRLG